MKDLYESYKSWCENSSLDPMHNTSFGKELTRLGFEIYKSNKGNSRIGISLKQSPTVTGDVASKLPMSLNAQMMRSKAPEAVLN
jgi:phage/plasmid-associated DNA primase